MVLLLCEKQRKEGNALWPEESRRLEKIKNWATPVILYDMPKDAPWDLCLQGLTNDDESKYGDVQWNWGFSSPVFCFRFFEFSVFVFSGDQRKNFCA